MAKMKNAGVTLNSAYLRPRSRGTVRLQSADPAARAADRSELLGRRRDRRLAIEGLRLAREIMRQPALKRFVLQEVLPGPGRVSERGSVRLRVRQRQDRPPSGRHLPDRRRRRIA